MKYTRLTLKANGVFACRYFFQRLLQITVVSIVLLPCNLLAQAPVISYSSPQTYPLGTAITPLKPTNTGGTVPATIYTQVTTFAGSGTAGSTNGTGTAASFKLPYGVATDALGNIYVADYGNNLIREISPAGVVTTLAGSGSTGSANGTGTAASFKLPYGVATDASGNVYVADEGNNLIRKITSAGVVTTFAGSGTAGSANGTGAAASFNQPYGVATDASGNVYVADAGNNLIREISPAGVVTTLAGSGSAGSANGTGTTASFNKPTGVATDAFANVYVADENNNLIREISPADVVTTLAGSSTAGHANGTGTAATFYFPLGVATDALGNVYVADEGNKLIREISPAGVVITLAGTQGAAGSVNSTGIAASFNQPTGVSTDAAGNVYVADFENNLLRKIAVTGYTITPTLPAGLSFGGTTGIISGTPTATSTATIYTLTAYNTGGVGTASVTISIYNTLTAPNITYPSPQTYTSGTTIEPLPPTNTGGAVPATIYDQVTTFAGSGTAGAANGTGTAASLKLPFGIATDASGNVYVADYGNNLIREISPAGVVTTFAGSGSAGAVNGTGASATFNAPHGVALDASGNVYVADEGNNLIRKITPSGVASTFAGSGTPGSANGTGIAASFNQPYGVAVDASGNVYVADAGNNLIREISPAGVVTTLAGSGTAGSANGTGTAATFNKPTGVALDAFGNVYVADQTNNLIRKITQADVVTTLAGTGSSGHVNGTATAATFYYPLAVATDAIGDVYVADEGNKLIREISAAGVVTTLAGTSGTAGSVNGIGTAASFNQPTGVAVDASGNLYVADYGNNLVRRITVAGYTITPALPAGLSFDGTTGITSGTPAVTTTSATYTVVAYNTEGSSTTTVAIVIHAPLLGPAITYSSPQTYPSGQAIAPLSPVNTGGVVPAGIYQGVSTFAGSGTAGSVNGTGSAASFRLPYGVATDASGNVYVADNGNNVIREITPAGVVTTLAGSGTIGAANGTGTAASFSAPHSVAIDNFGNLYVADYGNNIIRKITTAGVVTTFAGSGTAGSANGAGTAASFNQPYGIATDADGNVYVADAGNNLIREINPAGVVTTLAGSGSAGGVNGTGTAASFNKPTGVGTDAQGNVYVADEDNNLVRKINQAGVVTTLAGSGAAGHVNGTGGAATFYYPLSVTTDVIGNVYVADEGNKLIRKISPAGVVTTLAGTAGTAGSTNGIGTAASFNQPTGVATDAVGNIYVADYGNNLVRKIATTGFTITPALPAGLGFDGTTGIISGLPAATNAATTYTVTAYNTVGSATASLTITIVPGAPNISYTNPATYTTGMAIASLVPTNTGAAVPATVFGQVTTLAGSGNRGSANGTGTAASFNSTGGVATDASGNIYVADAGSNLIRKITPAGVVTTFAGSGAAGSADGTGTAASFNQPVGVATDASGNVYVADYTNSLIRKITSAGVVTTLAGSGTAGSANGTGTAASFNGPQGVATDASGNVYVADAGNNLIREITPAGVVTTFAGNIAGGSANGTGGAAGFNDPVGVATDASGNVYVADQGNELIRKITPAGVVTTLAGTLGVSGSANGIGTAASFFDPSGVATDGQGNVYVADLENNIIREITPSGKVTTLAGIAGVAGASNGTGTSATFRFPAAVALDAYGNLYVGDSFNLLIRKIKLTGYSITPALSAGLSFDATTGIISGTPTAPIAATTYIIEAYNTSGSSAATVTITVAATAPAISYSGPQSYLTATAITSLAPTNTGGAIPATIYSQVTTLAGSGSQGSANGTGTAASFYSPTGVATDAIGNVYVADNSNYLIRKITPAGVVTTLAGSGLKGSANGTGAAASFYDPYSLATDASGNVYVSDSGNNLVRKITPSGVVTTLAGSGTAGSANGTGTAASFNQPAGIATDASGNVYLADAGNYLVRKITPAGVVSTLAGSGTKGSANGTGTAASFTSPLGLSTDAQGNVYVADEGINRIRKITPAGVVTTLAGSGAQGSANGTGSAASFYLPTGVATDAVGNIYVADQGNSLIREITTAGVVTTLAGSGTAASLNGTGTATDFDYPIGVATDQQGNLYVADGGNLIRKIIITGYNITPALPAGLNFNAATGVISGTPTVASATTAYAINGINATGSSTATLTITVVLSPPAISYAGPQNYLEGTAISSLQPNNAGGAVPAVTYSQVTLYAGSGTAASVNGVYNNASFNQPYGTATDASGNVYVADKGNNLIRKIGVAYVVTTLAGSGTAGSANGSGTAASFNSPDGVATDAAGNVYVADAGNNLIREISPSGVVTTFAGSGAAGSANGTGTAASFNGPTGVATDAAGNVYVADAGNNLVREISPAGVVTTLAGSGIAGSANGTGTAASFNDPVGIATDAQANVYIADAGNNLVRKITHLGVVTILAGKAGVAGSANGTGTAASFNQPTGVATDVLANLYVADSGNDLIREITPAGAVTTLAGMAGTPGAVNGVGTAASFYHPTGVATDANGNVYVADDQNNLVRAIPTTGYVITPALPAGLSFAATTGVISGTPTAITAATTYTITAYNEGGRGAATLVIKITAPIPVISYAGPQTYTTATTITPLSPTNTGGAVPANIYGQVITFAGTGSAGAANGGRLTATFKLPFGVATDTQGNIYVADYGNNLIRQITNAGEVNTLTGSGTAGSANGTGTAASFNAPHGVATDASGNIYVADYGNNLIRKITPAGVVTTLAGSGTAGSTNGTGTAASFNQPTGVATDASGNVYVADSGNDLIREISPAGVVTTLAGSGTAGSANGTGIAASFYKPTGVATDSYGNVYVADNENDKIRVITPAGVVTTLAGSGAAGSANGTGAAASFYYPYGVATDAAGNVYVADESNKLIRKITPAGVVTTLAGTAGTAGSTNAIGAAASFNLPTGVAVDSQGYVYVADYDNNLVRRITATGYTITPALPTGLAFDGTTGIISGTPEAAIGTTTYTINAFNAAGSSTATVVITVVLTVPAISYAGPQAYTTGLAITSLAPINTGGPVPATIYSQVTTLAGSGSAGTANGTGTAASFSQPNDVATDAQGNVYLADFANNVIRKITPAGIVTTLAGSGTAGATNGTGTAATFNKPTGVATDAAGNIYVADNGNNLVRKITAAGVVTTFAGSGTAGSANGTGTAASFNQPYGIGTDASGNVYIGDSGNDLIREISTAGVVTTLAGTAGTAGFANGTGTAASFNQPYGITTDASANVYVADNGNNLVRKITPAGVVTTLAGSGTAGSGNGTGTAASFNSPTGVTTDALGNVYVADNGNSLVREISPAGVVTTLAGAAGAPGAINGTGTAASFNAPAGVAADANGNLYVADNENNLVRKIVVTGYTINLALPAGLSFNGTTGVVSGTPTTPVAATAYTIIAYNNAGNSTSTVTISVSAPIAPPNISYTTPQTYPAETAIVPLTPTSTGGSVPATIYSQVTTFAGSTTAGSTNGTGTSASFSSPDGLATDAQGNLYVADQGNNLIRKITPAGVVTTFAGSGAKGSANGTGTVATFNAPRGIATDAAGNVYVGDSGNNLIRKITPAGVVTTLAGNGNAGGVNGTGTAASFNFPIGVATDPSGNVYVADATDNEIRKITPAGVVTTLAGNGAAGSANGTGAAASFNEPFDVATDTSDNVYVADYSNKIIRKITPAGVVTTLAGSGTYGSANGTGTSASFSVPSALVTDAQGNVYVADEDNNLVRKITPGGVVTTLAGSGTAGSASGIGTTASFDAPFGITIDGSGNLYVADAQINLIQKIVITGYTIAPALPTGLSFDSATGVISGTPTESPAATYTVTAFNPEGAGTAAVTISVNPPAGAPNISYTGPQTYTEGTAITYLSPANSGGAVPATIYSQVSTFAGTGSAGSANGTGTAASFKLPFGVATDASGNVYVGDEGNNLIREISPSGVVTTLAGSGAAGSSNGTGTAASFKFPYGVALDASDNVYVADEGNNLIRKISPSGVVTTFAGSGTAGSANGTGTAASFNQPYGVATDASGNVYVADAGNDLIRKITPAGLVTTLAGTAGTAGAVNGTGTAASFSKPTGVATDALGNVYVADNANNLIREISPSGVVTTFAGSGAGGHGNGLGTAATFYQPSGVAADGQGNVYVADEGFRLIREITPAGVVTTLAGIAGTTGSVNGIGTAASFDQPTGVTVDASGNVYVADYSNDLIRKIITTGYTITPALSAGLSFDGSSGIISGTPTATSSATTYTVIAYNTAGSSTTTVSITVNAAPGPKVYYLGPQRYTVNTIITPLIPTNTGGEIPEASFVQDTAVVATTDSAHRSTPGVQFSRFIVNGTNYEARKAMVTGYGISPALPAGLSLDNSTGTISGIPTADIHATDFTITAYNLQGNSIAHLTITVNSLDINGKITKTGIDPYQASLDTTALAPIVHQAVSPNGDGKDDFLLIENITSYPDNKITLVDRNGALVYRAEGYDNANKLFDGHSSLTGALQKPGTYFYLLEYVDNGKTKRQTGFFVLKY